MRLFDLPGNGPFMNSERGMSNPAPSLLSRVHYQIVPGPRGLPMAQINLAFRRDIPAVANPEMTLAVLLDRSGSMQTAYDEGHVYNVAAAIFNHAAAAGIGYELTFYDDQVSDAGQMTSLYAVQAAVQSHPPRGGTYLTAALQSVISQHRTRPGMYIIVITDGEFADKVQVQQMVVQDLLPQVTPENPYAFRLHFVGAGEGVDEVFLRQIEAAASGQGVSMVSQHHHAHLSHSHASIFDEMDKAYLGVGWDAKFGDQALIASGTGSGTSQAITHTTDAATRRTWDGGVGAMGFLPRRALLGCELSASHSDTLRIAVQYQSPDRHVHQVLIPVPLPKQAVTTPAPSLPPAKKPGFHLPWIHRSPEQEAARAEMDRQRAEMAQQAAANRQTELQRQREDMQSLSQGGIPSMAAARLREIGSSGVEGVLFTSDLAPEEAGLMRREGYRVRGLVSGSAMYHVGQAYASSQGDCEVSVLSNAYDEATRLAMMRMRQELQMIGAHGVVGVRLTLQRHEWADKTVEVQAIGTAVEGPGKAPPDPWLSDLSGQEWWALHRAGYEPVGMVWGHCAWFILTTQMDEWTVRSYSNQELSHWSAALGRARHRAMAHVMTQAKNHGATGIAGVKFDRRLDEVRLSGPGEDPAYEREHHNLVVSIIGTAIRLRPDAPAGVRPTIDVLSLRDGLIAPAVLGAADAKIE